MKNYFLFILFLFVITSCDIEESIPSNMVNLRFGDQGKSNISDASTITDIQAEVVSFDGVVYLVADRLVGVQVANPNTGETTLFFTLDPNESDEILAPSSCPSGPCKPRTPMLDQDDIDGSYYGYVFDYGSGCLVWGKITPDPLWGYKFVRMGDITNGMGACPPNGVEWV